jgi:CBS domain-containing protein
MLKAKDIMTTDIQLIDGSATVADAVFLMKEKGLRALVVDRRDSDDVYGILTETDIVYKVVSQGRDPEAVYVHEIMTKPCIVVNPDMGVEYVARLFANAHISRALVIKEKLLGLVSVTDIIWKAL